MLSSKLIQLIEGHWDSITSRVLAMIKSDSRLSHVNTLPPGDLRDRARDILAHLGHWLSVAQPDELAQRFQLVGRLRYEEAIPLHETVLCYLIVKDNTLEFVRDQGLANSPVAIYAEEELEHSVSRFFDHAVYSIIVGYEEALNGGNRQRTAQQAAR